MGYMYDKIDINNNKNFYNFKKLDKLISYKDLLYNAILIYYILYNKFNEDPNDNNNDNNDNNNSNIIDKNNIPSSKIINNVIIYNKYENVHNKLYNELLEKFKTL